jgi:hypothetical protein
MKCRRYHDANLICAIPLSALQESQRNGQHTGQLSQEQPEPQLQTLEEAQPQLPMMTEEFVGC